MVFDETSRFLDRMNSLGLNEENNTLISNELEVTLPLDLSQIMLPDISSRRLDKDYYDEFMQIVEYENPLRKFTFNKALISTNY